FASAQNIFAETREPPVAYLPLAGTIVNSGPNSERSRLRAESGQLVPDIATMRIWVTPLVFLTLLLPFTLSFQSPSHTERFTPAHRLAGIGSERTDIPDDLLRVRTDLMIQSQTFAIMREAQSVAGADRITSPKLRALFQSAEKKSGFPASTLAAISYLES